MQFFRIHEETESYKKVLLAGQGIACLPNSIAHFSGKLSKFSTSPILGLLDPKLRKNFSKFIYCEPTDPFSPAEIGLLGRNLTVIDLRLVKDNTLLVKMEYIVALTGILLMKSTQADTKFDEFVKFQASDYDDKPCNLHLASCQEPSLIILSTPTPLVKQVLGERSRVVFCPADLIGMTEDCTVDKYLTNKLWGMKRIKGPGEVFFSGNITGISGSTKKNYMMNTNRFTTPKLCILAAALAIILAFMLVVSDAVIGMYIIE
jgi:hypothetical protein